MLQSDPALTPDQVKCRLLASAAPAITPAERSPTASFNRARGSSMPSPRSNSSATNCANLGLNIAADLAGTEHFGGPANQAANGDYYIMNMTGPAWTTAPQACDGLYLGAGLCHGPGLQLEPGLPLVAGL